MGSRVSQLTARTVKPRVLYRDFAPEFNLNPQTGELAMLINERSVINSIEKLVLTYPTERFYQPFLGSTVSQDLFEFVSEFNADRIKDTILQTLQKYEPRAQTLNVSVVGDAVNHAYNVTISFSLANLPDSQTSVPTIVLKVRD